MMGSAGGFGSFRHLAGRFVGALSPAGPSAADEAWALGWLLPGEQTLWARMSGPDRRHAVGVARDTLQLLAPGETARHRGDPPTEGVPREVVASALLHDVGKIESGLGTFARVGVTLLAIGAGRARLTGPAALSAPSRLRARIALYLTHDRVGGGLLRQAGSHELTISWAEQHHLPPERWTVEPRVAQALKAADGD